MLNKIEDKLKIKWWENFPVIGTMIYSIRVEWFLDKQEKIIRKNVKSYKIKFNLVPLVINLAFLITFLVLRNTHGYGPYPWFFWVGLGIGLGTNFTPYINRLLYQMGVKKWQSKIQEEKDIKK